jgi:hypothetical protein
MAAAHPDVERRVEIIRREIRTATGFLTVISSHAPKQHGLIPSLVIVDELHAHPERRALSGASDSDAEAPGRR